MLDWPEHPQFLNEDVSTSAQTGAVTQAGLADAIGKITLSPTTSGIEVSQMQQQDVASYDDAFQAGWPGHQAAASSTSSAGQPADRSRAALFAGEAFPANALSNLKQLEGIFSSLSGSVLENTCGKLAMTSQKQVICALHCSAWSKVLQLETGVILLQRTQNLSQMTVCEIHKCDQPSHGYE